MKRAAAAVSLAFALLAGCSSGGTTAPEDTKAVINDDIAGSGEEDNSDQLADQQCSSGEVVKGRMPRVVTTFAPLTNLTGLMLDGTGVTVNGLVPDGSTVHVHRIGPTGADLVQNADVVLTNGLGLEAGDVELNKQALPADAVLCEAGAVALATSAQLHSESYPTDGGLVNPHGWMSPNIALRYLNAIRDSVSVRMSTGIDTLDENYARLSKLMFDIDAAMKTATETVRARDRVLYSYHDSLVYMARYFGYDYLGAAQMPDLTEPEPTVVAKLISEIGLKPPVAVFDSAEFDSGVIAEIAGKLKITLGPRLADEVMPGKPGEARHSWAGMILENYIGIVETLGGDASALKAINPDIGLRDTAVYAAG